MITRRYQCRRCGEKFETKVFEKGEAEEKRIPTGPVSCPNCGGTQVEPAS